MSQQRMDIDMVNRDPNNLNDHVAVQFEEVLGEPDGAHSINCVWSNSFRCFRFYKSCCYNIMTILCGIPLAACWGCEYAYIAFYHIWYVTPCMRAYMIQCGCFQKFYGTCLQCFMQPLCEAFGYFFSNIRVTKSSG